MGKETLRHRAAHTSRELVAFIQSRVDSIRFERTQSHEQGHIALPPEVEEGLVEAYFPDGEATEIELFVDPLVKVRKEINEIKTPTQRLSYQVYELGGRKT